MFTNIKKSSFLKAASLSILLGIFTSTSSATGYGGPYNFGTPATAADIAAIDIDAMPDGRGLPAGSGDYTSGNIR